MVSAAGVADAPNLAEQYRADRRQAVESGAAARFPAAWLQRADDLARRAEGLQAAGLMGEAAARWRDARWQLPALPADFPQHVSRIFGNPRLKHGHYVRVVAYSRDNARLASASKDGTVRVWDLGNGRELAVFRGRLGDDMRAAAFAPDGRSIAFADGTTVKVCDLQSGAVTKTLTGHGGFVNCLSFRGDGARLATGSDDRTVRVWDVAAGKEVANLGTQNSMIHAVAYSADGKLLAAVNGDGRLSVYAPDNRERRQPLGQDTHAGAAYAVAFTPDGQTIVTAGADRKIVLIGAPGPNGEPLDGTGAKKRELAGHTEYVTSVAISHDGKTLASGSRDATVRLWDLATGRQLRTFLGHTEEVTSVAWAPDDRQIASGSHDQSVHLWNLESTDAYRQLAGHKGPVWSAAMSPDGRQAASGGADRIVRIWDVTTGRQQFDLAGHSQAVTAVAFQPGGPLLASASGDRTVRLWNVETGQAVRTLEGHEAHVLATVFHPNGQTLYSGGADRTVRQWTVATGQPGPVLNGHSAAVSALAIRGDGAQLASAGTDGTVKLWSTADGKLESSFLAHETGGVSAIAYSPDGQRLATCGADKQVRIWNPRSRPIKEPMSRILGHSGPVLSLAFSPRGPFLATGGADQVVKVWNIQDRNEVRSFRGHSDWVTSVAFSSDGASVASASVDQRVLLWRFLIDDNPASGGHSRRVTALSIRGDGKQFASASDDRTVRLWDAAGGGEILTLAGHTGAIVSVAVSPNGRQIATAGQDRKIKIWDPAGGREIAAHDCADEPLLLAYTPDGQRILSWLRRRSANEDDSTDTIQQFDAATLKPIDALTDRGRRVSCLTFSADGAWAAMGSSDGSVRLWDIAKKERVGGDKPVHSKALWDLALSPDKKTIIAADKEGDVKIAPVARNGEVRSVHTTALQLDGLQVSPDGTRLATFGDGRVELRNLANDEVIRTWSIPGVRTVAFFPNGRTLLAGLDNSTILALELP